MTKAAHTPGPWKARHWDAAAWEVDKGNPFIIAFPKNVQLLDELEANARLISAAPDLLNVAKQCLERNWNPFEPDNQSALWHELKAAIAKAEGKA